MKIHICLSNTEYHILSSIIKEHYPFTTFEHFLVNIKLSINIHMYHDTLYFKLV